MTTLARPFELRSYDADSSFAITAEGKALRLDTPVSTPTLTKLAEQTRSTFRYCTSGSFGSTTGTDSGVAQLLLDRARRLHSAIDAPRRSFTTDRAIVVGDSRIRNLTLSALASLHPENQVLDAGADPIIGANLAGRDGVLIVCRDRAVDARDVALCRHAEDMRVPYLLITRLANRLWIGPMHVAPSDARTRDAHERRIAASHDAAVAHALSAPAAMGSAWPEDDHLESAITVGLRLTDETPPHLGIHELRRDGGYSFHPVLPLTESDAVIRTCRTEGFTPAPDTLVDDQTGIIRAEHPVTHTPPTPRELTTHQARVSQLSAVTDGTNSIFCQGSTLSDPGRAKAGAIGESIERYCGNRIDAADPVYRSWRELNVTGLPAVHPDEFVLFAEEQYSAPGFPFQRFTEDSVIHWVWGHDLVRRSAVLVPAPAVYVNWHTGPYACDTPIMPQAFAGIAAGSTADMAISGAIEEIFERHATMVWWLSGTPLPRLRSADLPHGAGQRVAAFPIPNTLDATVMAVALHDDDRDLVNIGFSCHAHAKEALRKAWTEAHTLQEGSRDLLNPDNLHFRSINAGLLPPSSLKPHRTDRKYLDDFRDDFHDVDSLFAQQQIYLDPRTRERVSHLLDPEEILPDDPLESETESSVEPSKIIEKALSTLTARGLRAIDIDLTTSDAAIAGYHVHRVVVPGLIGNSSAAFPLLGRSAVSDEAIRLGWIRDPMTFSEINFVPMPHA